MNRLQKTAALYKVAKLKKAAAAMLLVRCGYMQKRAEDYEGTSYDGPSGSYYESSGPHACYYQYEVGSLWENRWDAHKHYVPVEDYEGNEIAAEYKDKLPMKEVRRRQAEALYRAWLKTPDREMWGFHFFDPRLIEPVDEYGNKTEEYLKALEDYEDDGFWLQPRTEKDYYGTPTGYHKPWYQNPWILGGGVAAGLGIAGLIYALHRRKKKKKEDTAVQTSTQTSSTTEIPRHVKVDKSPVDKKMRSYSATVGQDPCLDFIFQNDLGNHWYSYY